MLHLITSGIFLGIGLILAPVVLILAFCFFSVTSGVCVSIATVVFRIIRIPLIFLYVAVEKVDRAAQSQISKFSKKK